MRTLLLAVGLLLALTGCGSDAGHVSDPGGGPGGPGGPVPAMPSRVPGAAGTVATRDLATVMDTGPETGPELCLGAVAESWPPQCRGIPLMGWDWSERHGMFERSGDIRWGAFLVTGSFDGTTFTVAEALPAALYDPAASPAPDECADGEGDCAGPAEGRLAEIQRELERLPGVQSLWSTRVRVHADVVFDDGSLQAWADRAYGAGVVEITSALVPVQR